MLTFGDIDDRIRMYQKLRDAKVALAEASRDLPEKLEGRLFVSLGPSVERSDLLSDACTAAWEGLRKAALSPLSVAVAEAEEVVRKFESGEEV